MNLEDLPQLVMEKITSFFDHKQLLSFEQVSIKLKCAVDAHFSTTDHLIIGSLPKTEQYTKLTAKDRKCLDGLRKLIKRCGIRLRTIEFVTTHQYLVGTTSIRSYHWFCNHLLASAEVSNNCPNIENIIVSPNMDIITMCENDMFCQQNVMLCVNEAAIFCNNIKLSTGGTCKLRSFKLSFRPDIEELQLLNLFPNLEQICVSNPYENFYEFLPQLIEKGLKDLSILFVVDLSNVQKYWNIWKDLRTLRLGVTVHNVNVIKALNKLKLPKNVELIITISNLVNWFSHMNENVCNSIIDCVVSGKTDYRQISKFINLQQFKITDSEQLQVFAEGSFPKLRRILNRSDLCNGNTCVGTNTCHSGTFLPQLLINKGNQLTHIEIDTACNKSMRVVWKALKYCAAAISIRVLFFGSFVYSPLTVTYEDVEAICHLPNLQLCTFSISRSEGKALLRARFYELLDRVVKENTHFRYECGVPMLFMFASGPYVFSLYKINF